MACGQLYMTVGREKRQPENDGSYQAGDDPVTCLDVEVVKNMKEAKAWFRRMKIERPWEPRN